MALEQRTTEYYDAYRYTETPYIGGNAVPKQEPKEQREPRRKRAAQSQPQSVSFTKGQTIFLAIVTVALLASCVLMLSARAQITTNQKLIESTQSELQTVRANNDATEILLNKSIDMEEIFRIAKEELGMVYPSDDQIIHYTRSDGGYVKQNEDIPNS